MSKHCSIYSGTYHTGQPLYETRNFVFHLLAAGMGSYSHAGQNCGRYVRHKLQISYTRVFSHTSCFTYRPNGRLLFEFDLHTGGQYVWYNYTSPFVLVRKHVSGWRACSRVRPGTGLNFSLSYEKKLTITRSQVRILSPYYTTWMDVMISREPFCLKWTTKTDGRT